VVAIRNMSLLSSSKTVSELFGGARVMIARNTNNDFARCESSKIDDGGISDIVKKKDRCIDISLKKEYEAKR